VMLNRLLAFVGACGLLLAVTAMMPMEEAWANSYNCTDGCPSEDRCPSGSSCGSYPCKCIANPINETGCKCRF